MGIVSISNVATLGNVLDLKNPINLGIGEFINKKAFGYGLNAAGDVMERTTRQKVTKNLFDYVVKPGFTEGLFEEGLQVLQTKQQING
jgi:hypothetical protein